ncbi:MAG: hypothetical protein K2X29_01260 [Candidatus Obscuribacterales bacterium]|nr:hypothetical protein [Candidatus Obscuribacterales bacterium]
MTSKETEARIAAVAQIIDGRQIKDNRPLEVCVKGSVLGFPAAIEAINTNWPFGVTYNLDTKIVIDPSRQPTNLPLKMTITPRTVSGPIAIFARLLLFEAQGMPVGDKRYDSRFVLSFNNVKLAERFARYPGVFENITKLEQFCKFSELHIISDAGLSLNQPRAFKTLDLDICRETFRIMGELGQVLFDAF